MRPGFQFQDRDYQNPGLNIETETMNLQSQWRDRDYKSYSLSYVTKNIGLKVENQTKTENK